MTPGLTVELGARSYPIHFCADAGAALADLLRELQAQQRPVALLTDEGAAGAQAEFVARTFGAIPRLVVGTGEGSKSLPVYGRVLEFLAEHQVSRQGVLLVLGGGVVGDLGGFAAASYLRGIECVQIPTTLLAMVDSSVGGKTGLNLSAGKNLVGAFHHPRAVHIATDFLATLPAREFAAGAAEVVKYGLLGDAALFARLESDPVKPHRTELAAVIRRCCEMKAEIVRADERELAAEGGRALLNLGHTFGHAIEQVTGYGAAVAAARPHRRGRRGPGRARRRRARAAHAAGAAAAAGGADGGDAARQEGPGRPAAVCGPAAARRGGDAGRHRSRSCRGGLARAGGGLRFDVLSAAERLDSPHHVGHRRRHRPRIL